MFGPIRSGSEKVMSLSIAALVFLKALFFAQLESADLFVFKSFEANHANRCGMCGLFGGMPLEDPAAFLVASLDFSILVLAFYFMQISHWRATQVKQRNYNLVRNRHPQATAWSRVQPIPSTVREAVVGRC